MNHSSNPSRIFCPWLAIAISVVVGTSLGCVQRRFTIRSNPPGALVYIDDYEIGATPCSTDFTYYGTRKIRLVKDGYETLTVLQPVPTPWYQFPGLDFVSENLVPGEIRDERILDYQLQPQVIVPTEQLLGRAEELRRSTGSTTPQPGLPPAAMGSPPATAPPMLTPPTAAPESLPSPQPALPPPVGFDRFNY
jgi:hypothetical protein